MLAIPRAHQNGSSVLGLYLGCVSFAHRVCFPTCSTKHLAVHLEARVVAPTPPTTALDLLVIIASTAIHRSLLELQPLAGQQDVAATACPGNDPCIMEDICLEEPWDMPGRG